MKYNETVIYALEARREDLDVQIEEHRNIIATLEAEKEAIARELHADNQLADSPPATGDTTPKKRTMSAAARKRISRAMKARWKDRRKTKKAA